MLLNKPMVYPVGRNAHSIFQSPTNNYNFVIIKFNAMGKHVNALLKEMCSSIGYIKKGELFIKEINSDTFCNLSSSKPCSNNFP